MVSILLEPWSTEDINTVTNLTKEREMEVRNITESNIIDNTRTEKWKVIYTVKYLLELIYKCDKMETFGSPSKKKVMVQKKSL
jgi:hypothetical protein